MQAIQRDLNPPDNGESLSHLPKPARCEKLIASQNMKDYSSRGYPKPYI